MTNGELWYHRSRIRYCRLCYRRSGLYDDSLLLFAPCRHLRTRGKDFRRVELGGGYDIYNLRNDAYSIYVDIHYRLSS